MNQKPFDKQSKLNLPSIYNDNEQASHVQSI